MLKTRKSIAKRFKFTGRGKVLRRSAGYRHFLRNRSVKQCRASHRDHPVSAGFRKQILRAVAVGL